MEFTPNKEIADAVLSAAVVIRAVELYDEEALRTKDPLRELLIRFVEGDLYYSKALGAMARKLYAFVRRAIANPDRYEFRTGEQQIIAAALRDYEQHQDRKYQLHSEWLSEALDRPFTEAYPQPCWTDLSEQFLALGNSDPEAAR